MFKPHIGICVCHGKERLIVVKKGFCKIGNNERKGKLASTKRRIPATSGNEKVQGRSGLLLPKVRDSKKSKINRINREHNTSSLGRSIKGKLPSGKSSASAVRISSALDETKHHSPQHGWSSREGYKKSKPPIRKKRKPIQYRRKPTGEKEIFEKMLQEELEKTPEGLTCRCCPNWIGSRPEPSNFSHVLPKSTYPEFRLDDRNIWIVCAGCHHEWDFGDRSQEKFAGKREVADALRQESNLLRRTNLK